MIGSGAGADGSGRSFRVEYAIVDRGDEKVVARYLGPADAVAFNLGLIRRSLLSLEASQMLVKLSVRPPGRRSRARDRVVARGRGTGRRPGRLGAGAGDAVGLPPAAPSDNGLASGHPLDYTLMLRALRWTAGRLALVRAVEACGAGAGRGARAWGTSGPQYALRFERLGVPIEARGILVSREGESLLLELEAPVAKVPIVEDLYEAWVREVAAGH